MRHLSSLFVAVALVLGAGTATAETTNQETRTQAGPVELFFEFDSASIDDDATSDEKLKPVAHWARCYHRRGKIVLEGHADPIGTESYNVGLSARRSEAVRAKLIELGVKPEQIVLGMYGETGPLRENHAQDRRVTAKTTTEPLEAVVKREGENGAVSAMVVVEPTGEDAG
jgi:outer membrane protein OmpA-like peptidoglycan-associated protein